MPVGRHFLGHGGGLDHGSRGATLTLCAPASPRLQFRLSELLAGCGRGRYRDPTTQRCRGPADVGRKGGLSWRPLFMSELAHRVISLPHGNSVAFGLKGTLGRICE